MSIKISAMVLTKNEEDYIEYCLKSIRDIVDEIVIADGYSNDGTIGIAKNTVPDHKLKIVQTKVKNNFAVLRNFALKNITGDWVLVLDGDEVLAKPDGKPVTREDLEQHIKVAKQNNFFGYHIFTLHFLYNYRMIDGRNNGKHFSIARFYEKVKIIKYIRPIHELPEFKNGERAIATTAQISIFHFGHCKGMEDLRRKYRRSMTIKENPFRPEYEQYKNTDDYCKNHELFLMSRPIMFYYGHLPWCMNLW